jgi:hypothetical protein
VRPTLVSLAVLATLALAACGDKQLNTANGERFIRGVVVRQIGVRVASVTCPKDVTEKEGARFTCLVTGPDGSNGRVAVRQLGDSKIRVTAPFLHMREAEAYMAALLSRQVKVPIKVSCQEIVVVRKGDVFLCQAIYNGHKRTVSARMIDDAGHFRYRLTTDD